MSLNLFKDLTVLLIRPGALGDALLTLPVLSALRCAGARKVVVLGQPASWRFIPDDFDWIEKEDAGSVEWLGLYATEARLSERVETLLKYIPTAIAYLGSGNRICGDVLNQKNMITLLGEPPVWREIVDGFGREPIPRQDSMSLYDFHIESQHAARKLLKPIFKARAFKVAEEVRDIEASALRLDDLPLFKRSDAERSEGWKDLNARLKVVDLTQKKYVVLHPGSGGLRKCWPAKQFAELARLIQDETSFSPLILWGPADEVTRNSFQEALAGKNSIREVLDLPLSAVQALLENARLFIGNDSGVTHLAARLCTTVALFGPTDPLRWRPLGPSVDVIQAGSDQMAEIWTSQVFEVIWPLLAL